MAIGKRILLLYITERSGHHSAALAIKKALELKSPHAVIFCVNASKYAFPFFDRIIHGIYLTVIKRVPKIWEKMYDNPKVVAGSKKIKEWVHHLGIKRLKNLIEDFKPDVILCTQAFPCGIVADYKRVYRSSIPLIGVLTDFAPHSFWIYDNVDYYIAHSEETREMLMVKGVAPDKIRLLGIPIDPKFYKDLDRHELFGNYGLKYEVPVIMIMGGGRGLGPIKDALYELDVADEDLQIIVICGLNKRLYEWVIKSRFKNRILAFKFTDQIDRFMSMADVIITKPGGITTAEALAKKVPMVILDPIPGQEARNTSVLLKNEVAVKVDSASELWPAIKKILTSFPGKRGLLSKPESSLDIAAFVLSL